jgi:aspartate beta-hydroxylase
LEERFEEVAREFIVFGSGNFHTESELFKWQGDWKVAFLFESGRKVAENCDRLPITTSILERHDCVRRSGGLIYISRLAAGSRVAPHKGPTNLRLRCHLGVNIPDGECGLRVGETITRWTQGKCIVFDDHFEHEVWNESTSDRVILLIDLWHPELSALERQVLGGIQWLTYAQAESIAAYWKQNADQHAKDSVGTTASPVYGLFEDDH